MNEPKYKTCMHSQKVVPIRQPVRQFAMRTGCQSQSLIRCLCPDCSHKRRNGNGTGTGGDIEWTQ